MFICEKWESCREKKKGRWWIVILSCKGWGWFWYKCFHTLLTYTSSPVWLTLLMIKLDIWNITIILHSICLTTALFLLQNLSFPNIHFLIFLATNATIICSFHRRTNQQRFQRLSSYQHCDEWCLNECKQYDFLDIWNLDVEWSITVQPEQRTRSYQHFSTPSTIRSISI